MSKQNQEAFSVMVNHLRAQGEKSVGPAGFCKYRGENGLKCAVGALVDDEHYDNRIEGSCWSKLFQEAMALSGWTDIDNHLLIDTQSVHDAHELEEWEDQLKWVAIKHNLKMP